MKTNNLKLTLIAGLLLIFSGCHKNSVVIDALILGDETPIGYTEKLQADGVYCIAIPTSGNLTNTWQALEEMDDWLAIYQHEIVVLSFGLGEIVRLDEQRSPDNSADPVTSVADYELNLRLLVEQARKAGAVVIFTTMPDVPAGIEGFDPADVATYNAAGVAVMDELAVPVVDLNGWMKPYAFYQIPNSTGWTSGGYELMAILLKGTLIDHRICKGD